MGGDTGQVTLNDFELAQVEKARLVTAEQIKVARDLHHEHFAGDNTPGLLMAILNTVARNYATCVDNS